MSDDWPFGRQRQSVVVYIKGDDTIDVIEWMNRLMSCAEFRGDQVVKGGSNNFTIYPRAVND